MTSYDNWFCHRESLEGSDNTEVNNQKQAIVRGDDMRGMIHDAFGGYTEFIDSGINERGEMEPNVQENTDHPSKKQPQPEMDKFE
ncbi:hypothetical protein RDI58_019832 [Solanum bulbocastanum]|uniref:Uncharacterized protein n=1 Tax=Solanum bulbocastanum TaxID=147425 RepID=A0AAN8Y7Z6_SOLBU